MSELNDAVAKIITAVNESTMGMSRNDRAMVLLFVAELVKCTVDNDIYDTLNPKAVE